MLNYYYGFFAINEIKVPTKDRRFNITQLHRQLTMLLTVTSEAIALLNRQVSIQGLIESFLNKLGHHPVERDYTIDQNNFPDYLN
ncbi:hypothetical protein [Loigolactobacillus backii]|uniref:hypothetical protein n=1 Tax=Loigolactobacillus backii TaxID=375175 RepID=UPI000F767030|nr:hypothetical protein [Loigolactobacillus backii]